MTKIIDREGKGSFEFAANLQVKKGAALDPRTVVEKYEDLKYLGTWPYDASERKENGQVVKDEEGNIVYDYIVYLYKGLAVSVTEENCIYILKDPDNFNQDFAWERIGSVEIDGDNISLSDNYEENLYPENTGVGEFTSISKGESLDNSISKLEKNIINLVGEVIDNELVVSSALTDLDSRSKELNEIKAEKATTLEGYGITDAHISDSGVITLGNKTITPITSETLPSHENLIIQKNGTTIATYNGSSAITANISFTAADLGLSSALKYCGITTTSLTDGATTNPIIINGGDHTATPGCVVFYGDKEFVFNGTNWEELGYPTDLSNYVTLNSNQTISSIKTFTNQININNKTLIESNIDSGELKVFHKDKHDNKYKGFIVRTNSTGGENIYPLELLSTNTESSYQYNFPKRSGDVAIGAKVNGETYLASKTDGLIDFGTDLNNIIETTYSNLKSLRDNFNLLPGHKYRITDYITTTSKTGTSSAGHQFDLIVEALSNNALSENVGACVSRSVGENDYILSQTISGFPFTMGKDRWSNVAVSNVPQGILDCCGFTPTADTDIKIGTFTKSCNAGTLKLSFNWVSGTGNKKITCLGVDIVRNGEVVFADYHKGSTGTSNIDNNYTIQIPETAQYVIRFYVDNKTEGIDSSCQLTAEVRSNYFSNNNLKAWTLKYCLDNDINRFEWANSSGKGVIYYMKDDFNNECPYDFKNILFDGKYTFTYKVNDVIYDGSIKSDVKNCYNNRINPFYDEGKQILNHIVFENTSFDSKCILNVFENNCRENTFGDGCYNNLFESNCYYNTFGSGCYNNILKGDSRQNTFGNTCYNNTLGEDCSLNEFADKCALNVFSNTCKNNTFGETCTNNTFSSSCSNNTFGENCSFNNFATFCSNNTFGSFVQSNDFGQYSTYNKFGDYILRNTIGKKCNNCKITVGNSADSTYASYVKMITFGDECTNLQVCLPTSESGSTYFQNYYFHNSLTGSIEIDTTKGVSRGRSYTTFVGYNSSSSKEIIQTCQVDHYIKPSDGIPSSDLSSDVQTALTNANNYKGTITEIKVNGTSIATSGSANISSASTSAYGVTKLSDSISSTSTSLAATANSVKEAYDLANGKLGKNENAVSATKANQDGDGNVISEVYLKKSEAKGEALKLTDNFIPTKFPENTGNGEFIPLEAGETIESAISKLDQNLSELVTEILDNEEVISSAFTDLNEKINEITSKKEILSDNPQIQSTTLGGNPIYKKIISLEYTESDKGNEKSWAIPCSSDTMGVILLEVSCILTQVYEKDGVISFDYRDNASFNKNSNNLVYFYQHNTGNLIIRFTSSVSTTIFGTILFSTSNVIEGGMQP